MHSVCRRLLEKLLDSWQSNPERVRTTTLPISKVRAPAFYKVTTPDEKEALLAGLEEAAACGAIELDWGKGFASKALKRLVLLDGPLLAAHLGRSLASRQAEEAQQPLKSALSGNFPWIGQWVEELLDRWGRNKSLNGLGPEDSCSARQLVLTLEAVAAGRQANLDLRTFSVRELGDSKAVEGLLSKFAAVWKRYHPCDLTTDELAQSLGLVKFPPPLLLKGPIVLHLANRDLDCRGIQPFVGLPPQAVKGIDPGHLPEYVLTIENLASFNRYAAEIADNGLVIYTAGFPAPGVSGFLRGLADRLSADIPFYHWGDMDEGGLKIFAYVQALLLRPLLPHLMAPDLLARLGNEKPSLRSEEVLKTASVCPAVNPLVDAMLFYDPPKVLEQENIDPQAPAPLTEDKKV